MKQKFIISKSEDQKEFKIEEFAELEKDIMSLMCEEKYESKNIKSAISAGKENLISALRTKNFFPPHTLIHTIADSIIELHGDKQLDSLEVLFDDKDDKPGYDMEPSTEIEGLDDDIEEVDDSEPDEFDQLIDDSDQIKDGVIPIKIDEFENEDREEDI